MRFKNVIYILKCEQSLVTGLDWKKLVVGLTDYGYYRREMGRSGEGGFEGRDVVTCKYVRFSSANNSVITRGTK